MRGTSRREEGLAPIEEAGIEAAIAEPDRVGTVLEHVGDVAIVYLLLGSAAGASEDVAAIHGPRLERLMERLVDTPVRGVVYEATGTVDSALLEAGAEIVRAASRTWHIPVEIVTSESNEPAEWPQEMADLALGLLSPARGPK